MQENLKSKNIKSGFQSILVTGMLTMMTTGQLWIGLPSPDGGGGEYKRYKGKHQVLFPQPIGLLYMASIY
jgi:hypothetical protein